MSEELHLTETETLRIVSETPDALAVEANWGPSGTAPPAHLHPAQDEHFEITAGQLRAELDGRPRELKAGDTLDIPRGTPHRMWNPHDAPASASWRTTPGGRTAEWFRTVDRLTDGGRRKPPLPAIAKAMNEFGDTFVLTAGPKPLQPVLRAVLRAVALADR
jgi:mannose-6-phosphate isomerase-like protein (cupin superfamily)